MDYTLQLADGVSLTGKGFGAVRPVAGEVVFNTGMSGYVEALTDPSYKGQILVLTYPLQGNYGVPKAPWESGRIQVEGLIVSSYTTCPSHHRSERSLSEWLVAEGVPAVQGIDTRSLTRHLRNFGTLGGLLTPHTESPIESRGSMLAMKEVLAAVVPPQITRVGRGSHRVLVLETGTKHNIVHSLLKRDTTLVCAPWNLGWEEYLGEVDGILLTNGPGDPRDAESLVHRIRPLIEGNTPLFGICLGHQILALAAGARITKMKYGHRGVNQPVQDLLTGRACVTSQNHGYMVDTETLPRDWQPWFQNLNDGTNEGIRHLYKPLSSVQFHPEACPGPNDTAYLFDEFIRIVSQTRQAKQTPRIDLLPEWKP